MKKTFITFAIIIASLSGFSQSFSADSKSISVPRYANQTAITTAIPSPTVGMLVYNNALNQYAYWNGSAWTNLSAGASGPALWGVNASNRIEANTGYPNGIEILRMTTQGGSSLASPLLNSIGANTVFMRYGAVSSTAAVFQESTAGNTRTASSLNFRHANNASPQVITDMFGFDGATSTFSVNGFTQLGEEATTTTSGVTKSSPAIKTMLLTGSLTQGSTPETSASLTTTVPHGLNYNKIVDIKVLVNGVGINGGFLVAEGATQSGLQFSTYMDGNNIYINRSATNSGNIRPDPGFSTAVYRILITYIP